MKKKALILTFSVALSACQPVTPEPELHNFLPRVRNSYQLAEQWFTAQVQEKGILNYNYWPRENKYPDTNNAIRQLMGARLLAEITHKRPDLLELHRKNLNFYMKYWYQETDEGLAYVWLYDKSKLGANAMLLRTLLESPDYELYAEEATKLKDGILSLIEPDNSFRPWFFEPGYAYDKDYILTFYSGEALLALVEYYNKTKDKEVLQKIIAVQDFYVDRYVDHLEENYYPAYVPWHTMSLNKLWKITKDPNYARAIFVLTDELLTMQDTTNFVGRFYNPATPQYGKPHTSSDGVYTEGLSYAYEIAKLTGDTKRMNTYAKALELALRNLESLQYTIENTKNFPQPELALGGFKLDSKRTGMRIDCTQHTMDAYLQIMRVFE